MWIQYSLRNSEPGVEPTMYEKKKTSVWLIFVSDRADIVQKILKRFFWVLV